MRWKPSPEQISLAIDCATARVSIGSAAALLGISPRTMRAFLNRLEKARAQKAISSGTASPLTAKSADPAHSGIAARECGFS
jgi:hypothetical protein